MLLSIHAMLTYLIHLDDVHDLEDLLLQTLDVQASVVHVHIHRLAQQPHQRQGVAVRRTGNEETHDTIFCGSKSAILQRFIKCGCSIVPTYRIFTINSDVIQNRRTKEMNCFA
jgi:hypothetical protein